MTVPRSILLLERDSRGPDAARAEHAALSMLASQFLNLDSAREPSGHATLTQRTSQRLNLDGHPDVARPLMPSEHETLTVRSGQFRDLDGYPEAARKPDPSLVMSEHAALTMRTFQRLSLEEVLNQ